MIVQYGTIFLSCSQNIFSVGRLWPRVAVAFIKQSSSTNRRSQLQEDTNFRVLRMLLDNPDMTQREIAEKLGVSTSGINYCLKALIGKGFLKVQNFSLSKNKFGYIYVLTPNGIAEKAQITNRFLSRKMAEYEALRAEIESLRDDAYSLEGGGGR